MKRNRKRDSKRQRERDSKRQMEILRVVQRDNKFRE